MSYEEFIQNILDARGNFGCDEGYYERHHIIPKCLGGTDDKNNLIDLYAREHFIAHKLLVEENPENEKLIYAWWMMAHCKTVEQDRYECTPEEYEESRIAFSVMHSERLKGVFVGEKNYFYDVHMYGDNNPMFGKHHTDESKRKNSESNKANWTDNKRKSFGESRKGAKNPNSKTVYQYDKDGDFIKEWGSTMDVERELNIDSSSVARCARGQYKTAGGFIWKYTLDN